MSDATLDVDMARSRFLVGSKRMASEIEGSPIPARADVGAALMELLAFADMVKASQPPRPSEPLKFPPLSELFAAR